MVRAALNHKGLQVLEFIVSIFTAKAADPAPLRNRKGLGYVRNFQ